MVAERPCRQGFWINIEKDDDR